MFFNVTLGEEYSTNALFPVVIRLHGSCDPYLKVNLFFVFYRQLITHLKVFSKFVNPRSLYLERSLSELYNKVKQNPPISH